MRILIVIPLYGPLGDLRQCLTSLGVSYPGDDFFEKVANILPFEFGDILVRNNNIENVGFTRAVNDGMRASLTCGYDAVWVMGDDMKVMSVASTIHEIEKEFLLRPRTGIIGLQLREMDDPDLIYHGGTLRAYPTGLHKWGRVSRGDLSLRSRERWVPGGAMVISSRCIREIGVMDERFFNICSDSDYCYRARAKGFDVVYLPIPVLHASGGISQNPNPQQLERLQRDILSFRDKWLGDRRFALLDTEAL